jgi:predicted dehydrogenase
LAADDSAFALDYTKQPLRFKVRKVARYARLYGPRRTLVKVQSQYHMKRRFARLPSAERDRDLGHVGIIGCGKFAYGTLAYFLKRNYGSVMRAAMDIDIHRAASLHRRYGLAYYSDDAGELLDDPRIDLLFIASNHASHAPYAIEALKRGKSVHIEKPHVVSREQLRDLCTAMEASKGHVALGFNRPESELGKEVQRALAGGTGAAMYNWFIAGHHIPPDHWYYSEAEGGRVLGNLCHWTDFVYRLVEGEHRYPITISPLRGEQSDCDVAVAYRFGEGSIAAITFSAKGHTFEGVREIFAAQRGDVLVSMRDFAELTIEARERKRHIRRIRRDHGHEARVQRSYEMVRPPRGGRLTPGESTRYVWETGDLFLKTRDALESDRRLVLEPYGESGFGRDVIAAGDARA